MKFEQAKELGAGTSTAPVHVLMAVRDRVRHLEHYLQEGLWDDVPLVVVDDGAQAALRRQLQRLAAHYPLAVAYHAQPQGESASLRTGLACVAGGRMLLVGPDDFVVGLTGFVEALPPSDWDDDALLHLVPHVLTFNESCQTQELHDRQPFDGISGRGLLHAILERGTGASLARGACVRHMDLELAVPDPFFQQGASLAWLARLCGTFPDRCLRVSEEGRYMLLSDDQAHGVPQSADAPIYHLLAQLVAGYYLMEFGEVDRAAIKQALLRQGRHLQRTRGAGLHVAAALATLLMGEQPSTFTREANATLTFLHERLDQLPDECDTLLRSMLVGQPRPFVLPRLASARPAQRPIPHVPQPSARGARPPLFVGGGLRSGAAIMHSLLCQADDDLPIIPPLAYLRSLLQGYRHNANPRVLQQQVPYLFDGRKDYDAFVATSLEALLDRLRQRMPAGTHLVLRDIALTPFFPVLQALQPGSRFICMVRDPRDAIAGLMTQASTRQDAEPYSLLRAAIEARDMERLCDHYRAYYAPLLAMDDPRKMEQVLFVRYEDLIVNTEAMVGELAEHTGLHFPPTVLSAAPGYHGVDSRYLGRQPAAASDFFTTAHLGTHTRVLNLREIQQVEALCADHFELFRYPLHLRATG